MTDHGLLSTLPERPREGGPAWLAELRRAAASRLREGGFPGKKHEKWRFTSVREVVGTAFRERAPGDPDAVRRAADALLGDDGAFRVVLADGSPLPAGEAPHGVRALPLREALAREGARLEPVLGKLAPAEHFAALNAAMFIDGLLVVIEAGAIVERPISIVHVASASDAPSAVYPRVVVIAERGSQATLIETFLTAPEGEEHLTNAVAEIALEDGARLDHTRIVLGAGRAFHLAHLAVRQGRDSAYGSHVLTLGGALSRLELEVTLAGEGAEAVLDGVYHVDGSEHVDHQVFVDHAAPHTSSQARYRGLLDGKGHAVVNVMGAVRKSAPGTSAHQENRNLLLSDDATIDTKPHLEIETDDVKASHGATIGAVDETALFYLRSRGVPEALAKDVLTFAFVRELIERIPHGPTAARASDAVLSRLPSGPRIRELFA